MCYINPKAELIIKKRHEADLCKVRRRQIWRKGVCPDCGVELDEIDKGSKWWKFWNWGVHNWGVHTYKLTCPLCKKTTTEHYGGGWLL